MIMLGDSADVLGVRHHYCVTDQPYIIKLTRRWHNGANILGLNFGGQSTFPKNIVLKLRTKLISIN